MATKDNISTSSHQQFSHCILERIANEISPPRDVPNKISSIVPNSALNNVPSTVVSRQQATTPDQSISESNNSAESSTSQEAVVDSVVAPATRHMGNRFATSIWSHHAYEKVKDIGTGSFGKAILVREKGSNEKL